MIQVVLNRTNFALSKLGLSHEEFVRGLPPRQLELAQDGLEDVVVRVSYLLEAARMHEANEADEGGTARFVEQIKARRAARRLHQVDSAREESVDHADQ